MRSTAGAGALALRSPWRAEEEADAALVRLAADGAPLRRALARLAGWVVGGRAGPARAGLASSGSASSGPAVWEALGFVRVADYARERLGLAARELQDLAQVDAKLAALPAAEAAFLAGRITWSKVRLLCRVATAEDEAPWLARAERASAAGLAREVRRVERECLEAGAGVPAGSEAAPEADPPGGDQPGTDHPGTDHPGTDHSGTDHSETDESGAPEEPRETLRIPCPARVAAKWGAARQLARRVAGEWLPAADCAEAIAAEAVSALLPLEADPEALPPAAASCPRGVAGGAAHPGTDPEASPPQACTPSARPAPAEPSPFVTALLDGIEGADAFELDGRLRRAVALERSLLARLGPPLAALAAERGFRALGFTSLDLYARERLGMAPRKARALLRLERACQRSPALRRAWRSGALSWCQAQTLVAVALAEGSGPWLEAWIERAGGVTVRRLEDDVDHALATGCLDPAALPPLPVPLYELIPAGAAAEAPAGVQIRALTRDGAGDGSGAAPGRALELESWRWRSQVWIHGPVPVVRLLRACLFTVQRRIERHAGRPSSMAEALEALLDHVLESWRALEPRDRRTQREHRVFARDGWRCTIPGCSSYRNLHAHHVHFRSRGGNDRLENLTAVCTAHHHRGIHAARMAIRGLAPGRLRFDLPFASFRSGDVVVARAGAGGAAS